MKMSKLILLCRLNNPSKRRIKFGRHSVKLLETIIVLPLFIKKNNFRVSDSGYIIYCNAIKNTKRFESRLMFSTNLFSNNLKYDWIEEKLSEIFEILQGHNHPPPSKIVNIVNM